MKIKASYESPNLERTSHVPCEATSYYVPTYLALGISQSSKINHPTTAEPPTMTKALRSHRNQGRNQHKHPTESNSVRIFRAHSPVGPLPLLFQLQFEVGLVNIHWRVTNDSRQLSDAGVLGQYRSFQLHRLGNVPLLVECK